MPKAIRSALSLLLIVIIFIFLSGCSSLRLAVGRPGDFFPLTQGSYWRYQGEGMEFASFTREVIRVNGKRAQTRLDNGGTIVASVFETTEDSITQIYSEGEAYEDPNLLDQEPRNPVVILKAPLKTGTKWETPDGQREIVSDDVRVQTPAGTFENCLQVKITTTHSIINEFYKEQVGLVRREFTSEAALVTSTLTEYRVE